MNTGQRILSEFQTLLAQLKDATIRTMNVKRYSTYQSVMDYFENDVAESDRLNDKVRRLCQICLSNPWVIDQMDWNNQADKDDFIKMLNDLLYQADHDQMNNQKLREAFASGILYGMFILHR